MKISTRERFESKVQVLDNGCWKWMASCDRDGYGTFKIKGKQFRANRAAYEIYLGKIPDNILVLHSCDNPWCVSPEHLFLGDWQDNMDDKHRKGREKYFKGEQHPAAKLSNFEATNIRIIRKLGARAIDLAEWFGVSSTQIVGICNGRYYV